MGRNENEWEWLGMDKNGCEGLGMFESFFPPCVAYWTNNKTLWTWSFSTTNIISFSLGGAVKTQYFDFGSQKKQYGNIKRRNFATTILRTQNLLKNKRTD